MSNKKSIVGNSLLWLVLLIVFVTAKQCATQKVSSVTSPDEEVLNIMFYNVENLFDTKDDPKTNDQDFLPNGNNHWTHSKYQHKLNNLYKVIAAVGGMSSSKSLPPDIIGMCEVENMDVLLDLTKNTPLSNFSYGIIHQDSPDSRGIDVALLYRPERYRPIDYKYHHIISSNKLIKTRDILHVKGLAAETNDTVHVFVCHWPSKINGAQSEGLRQRVAEILKSKVDSLLNIDNKANIIIGGDFNDTPDSPSVINKLKAVPIDNYSETDVLVNTSKLSEEGFGSYSYQNEWSVIDQIIVSKSLLNNSNSLHILPDGYHIYVDAFLLEDEVLSTSARPFRSFKGSAYIGGYSDHLPVGIKLYKSNL